MLFPACLRAFRGVSGRFPLQCSNEQYDLIRPSRSSSFDGYLSRIGGASAVSGALTLLVPRIPDLGVFHHALAVGSGARVSPSRPKMTCDVSLKASPSSDAPLDDERTAGLLLGELFTVGGRKYDIAGTDAQTVSLRWPLKCHDRRASAARMLCAFVVSFQQKTAGQVVKDAQGWR